MEKAPGNFNANRYLGEQRETFDWLMAEAVPLTPEAIITVGVTDEDLGALEEYRCEDCGDGANFRKVRVGFVKPVNASIDLADQPAREMLRIAPEGGLVWTAAAESRDAVALRLHFTDFSLPHNAALYIYNFDGEAFGPYTGRGPGDSGDFWSHTISGPVAYIQLRFFGAPHPAALQNTHFVIRDVGHLGPKFLLPFLRKTPGERENLSRTEEHCSYNEPCIEDASCYSGGALSDVKNAVAYMQWISGAWIYMCTGGLLADTDTGSQTPYFLTANHCISKKKDAAALECYFQYWTSNCGSACYDPVSIVPRTLGADFIGGSSKNGDYTLLKLWEDPPPGSVFLGWTTADAAHVNGMELFRISHPSGAPQAYSKHRVDTSSETCTGWPRGQWIYSRDIVGATEGGSSGAPLLNLNGQVVGQLSGACGYNVTEACDPENNATVDGAFAAYFHEIEQWLAPR
jgi:V8-like Glu-specific endopeptidase